MNYYSHIWNCPRYGLPPPAPISFSSYFDENHLDVVDIGEETLLVRGTVKLTHNFTQEYPRQPVAEKYNLIGAKAVVRPGANIRGHVLGGAAVIKNAKTHLLVLGN